MFMLSMEWGGVKQYCDPGLGNNTVNCFRME